MRTISKGAHRLAGFVANLDAVAFQVPRSEQPREDDVGSQGLCCYRPCCPLLFPYRLQPRRPALDQHCRLCHPGLLFARCPVHRVKGGRYPVVDCKIHCPQGHGCAHADLLASIGLFLLSSRMNPPHLAIRHRPPCHNPPPRHADPALASLRAWLAWCTGSPSTSRSSLCSCFGFLCRPSSTYWLLPIVSRTLLSNNLTGAPSSSSDLSWCPPLAATSTSLALPPAVSAPRPRLTLSKHLQAPDRGCYNTQGTRKWPSINPWRLG